MITNKEYYIKIILNKKNSLKKINKWLKSNLPSMILHYQDWNPDSKEKYNVSTGQTVHITLERNQEIEMGYTIGNVTVTGDEYEIQLPEIKNDEIKRNRQNVLEKQRERNKYKIVDTSGIRKNEMKDIHKVSDPSRGKVFTKI